MTTNLISGIAFCGVGLLIILIGFKVTHGEWLHFLAGNIFGDNDKDAFKHRKGIGLFLIITGILIIIFYFLVFIKSPNMR
ncbi:hypothetical protein LASUN_26030 [Lentilactobacillus sunkii]|uniref:DUF3784 domain-containing protein n=1 Tax=Lentilactobacillus sunkii TaxID=481719 RepID=A0A1E7X873_9LACO|nr:hypothetical protein [Lentilactobacillus sunkii]OFA09336.1 hypothetical protein LASUN_26030 [Lentilactobacillus sunkii]